MMNKKNKVNQLKMLPYFIFTWLFSLLILPLSMEKCGSFYPMEVDIFDTIAESLHRAFQSWDIGQNWRKLEIVILLRLDVF
jgi:hypothetical protein